MKRGHPKFALRQGTVMEVIPGLGFLCTRHLSSSVMLPSSQVGDFGVEGDAKRGIYGPCSCAWTCAVGQPSSLCPAELTLLPKAIPRAAPRPWSPSSLLLSALEKALGSSYSDLQSSCHALNA